jgi:hypothetical protein
MRSGEICCFVSPAVILSYVARPRGWPIQARVWLEWAFAFAFLSVISARAFFLMVLAATELRRRRVRQNSFAGAPIRERAGSPICWPAGPQTCE